MNYLFKQIQVCFLILFFCMLALTPFLIQAQHLQRETIDHSSFLYPITHIYIDSISPNPVYPGETIHINGIGFGTTPGYIILSGLQIQAESWTDTKITCTIPDYAASGPVHIRDAAQTASNSIMIQIHRDLLSYQFEPSGLLCEDIGFLGAAFLVETDGSYMYGITGFETLSTYKLHEDSPATFCSRTYLSQRVGDLQIYQDYLFCTGDHGLSIFRCRDLQKGVTSPIIEIAGGSYLTLDIQRKQDEPINGILLALCEYLPQEDNMLSIPLFEFLEEELRYLGSYSRIVLPTERQHAIAIDPLNPKVYVSGFETLLGEDKYILELDISDMDNPTLLHREETGGMLAFDMDVYEDRLWMGILNKGTELFRSYSLYPGDAHLQHHQSIEGAFGIGRTTRVRIIDEQTTVGCAWSGARPDVFLFDTLSDAITVQASDDSLDWAFDVTGTSSSNTSNKGRLIVADEWGGFLTYTYDREASIQLTHQQDYQWIPAAAMTEHLHITNERVYLANRGAGIWSADKNQLSDQTSWKYSAWDWSLEDPQPYPISALCTREDTTYGTLIAARGNNKAMAWGDTVSGMLYQETDTEITLLAKSEDIDPPGGFLSGSPGISVLWPEQDLVFMATGTDGFRAFIIDPDEPSISLHQDCQTNGFCSSFFGTNRTVHDMHYYTQGSMQKIILGSTLAPLVGEPSIMIFSISYPEGIPNRANPDRPIELTFDSVLNCSRWKDIHYFDVSSTGLVTAATSHGLIVFPLSWISYLNTLPDAQAWNRIVIPTTSFEPWWDDSYSLAFNDVGFVDDHMLYVVKTPQGKNPGGVWRLFFTLDDESHELYSQVQAYYPGVQCGIDYSYLLSGWSNPDIQTIHHPYALGVDGDKVYVTGWSGKVNVLSYTIYNNPPTIPEISGPTTGKTGTSYTYTFTSYDPEGDEISYYVKWGDNTIGDWYGPFASGETCSISHSFDQQGSYLIEAKAKDINNANSEYNSLQVSMPKMKQTEQDNFYWFIHTLQRCINSMNDIK